MTEHRQQQIERLLRISRQRVFDDSRYERLIDACKRRLRPVYDARAEQVRERRNAWRWL